jgi:predicted CXXCH cytochrome family protein
MSVKHLVLAALGAGILGSAAWAAERSLAPIPQEQATSTHGPFEMGECAICHEGQAPRPGKVLKAANDLCFDCHEEFKVTVKNHPSAKAKCTQCHSPHNSRKRKLLR